jgi:GDP-L-fucose synthase
MNNNIKKILITGSSGMVGRNVINLNKNYTLLTPSKHELNLLNYSEVFLYINREKPDCIIHAAGYVGGIQANILDPYKFIFDNSQIGLNIVNAAKDNNIKYFINLASSCMYPRNIENPLKEEYILKGELETTNEGYALAKILVTKLCSYLSEKYGFNYITLIPCNLYGYWDKFDPIKSHMIPAIISKIHNSIINDNSIIEIWGSGKARREFMFAEDLADFIYFSINNIDRIPNIINVGIGTDYSIEEYYSITKKVLNAKGDFYFNTSKPEGMKQKLLDVSKQNYLGWSPNTSLEDGIKKTYEHYLKFVYNK